MKRWSIALPFIAVLFVAGARSAIAQDFTDAASGSPAFLAGSEEFGLEPLASKTAAGKDAKDGPKAAKKDQKKAEAKEVEDPAKADVLWCGFSARMDLLTIDLVTRTYIVGLTPGLGWGIRWKPSWWSLTDSFLSGDIFFEASIQPTADGSANYGSLRMTVIPVITILDSISVGFGVTYSLSLIQGQADSFGTLLSVGVGTSLTKSADASPDKSDG